MDPGPFYKFLVLDQKLEFVLGNKIIVFSIDFRISFFSRCMRNEKGRIIQLSDDSFDKCRFPTSGWAGNDNQHRSKPLRSLKVLSLLPNALDLSFYNEAIVYNPYILCLGIDCIGFSKKLLSQKIYTFSHCIFFF